LRLNPMGSEGDGLEKVVGVDIEPGFEIIDLQVLFVDPQIPLDRPVRERAGHGQNSGLCRRGQFISEQSMDQRLVFHTLKALIHRIGCS
jgi:hypothetical protein